MSLLLFVAGERQAAPRKEVYWPGTKITRDRFKAMQRESLGRYLDSERERLAKASVPVTQRQVKKAAKRVINRIANDYEVRGILTPADRADLMPAAITAIQTVGQQSAVILDFSEGMFLRALRIKEAIEARREADARIAEYNASVQRMMDEDAASILLLLT